MAARSRSARRAPLGVRPVRLRAPHAALRALSGWLDQGTENIGGVPVLTWRRWETVGDWCHFILYKPPTDAELANFERRARAWRFAGVLVTSLRPGSRQWIERSATVSKLNVAAWGNAGDSTGARTVYGGYNLMTLGLGPTGSPINPLYVPIDVEPAPLPATRDGGGANTHGPREESKETA